MRHPGPPFLLPLLLSAELLLLLFFCDEAAVAAAAPSAAADPCHEHSGPMGLDPMLASLRDRFCKIMRRTAWGHEFLLPGALLARAYSIVGDDSRLRTFVHKLVLGKPVHYAHLGGSISVFALAKSKDLNWHAMFHRWLELAFTPCGDVLPSLTARDPWPLYAAHLHVCPLSTVSLTNHAIGATSCIFAEKCIVQRVNHTHTDWVLVEYTQNAIKGLGSERLDTTERRALERMVRKLLLLPSHPALTLMHSYAVSEGAQFGGLVEDWHNQVLQYYGNVQAISVRAAIYDLVWRHNISSWGIYMTDGLHPAWLGHLIWADIMIYTFKQLATEVMSDMVLHSLVPEAHWRQSGPPNTHGGHLSAPLPDVMRQYWTHAEARHRSLPPPLIPGNGEDSDGFCFMGEALLPLVPLRDGGGWSWVDEGRGPGRSKWGFVSRTPGSQLVIKIDSTVGGQLHVPGSTAAAQPQAHDGAGQGSGQAQGEVEGAQGGAVHEVQTLEGMISVNTTHAQVMLGYLSSYQDIGGARVSCVSGCSCEEREVQALWEQKYSATAFLYMMVSAHPRCRIQVEVLAGPSTKFKVEGVIINTRPYFWDAASTGTHYEFMATDLFNNLN